MPPLPYPYRASFLASAMALPSSLQHLALLAAKLLGATLFDHLVRHPVLTVGDFDDERLTDDDNNLLDARHPDVEDTIDWFFRVNRRDEVLWLECRFDPARCTAVRLRAPAPAGRHRGLDRHRRRALAADRRVPRPVAGGAAPGPVGRRRRSR